MQAAIIERPLTHFVGLKLTASYDSLGELLPETRKSLLARQYNIHNLVDPYVQWCVTKPHETEASEDQVTTYIGFEVTEYKDVPSDLTQIELPGGFYGQFLWKGSMDSDDFEYFYPSIFNWFQAERRAPSMENPWIEVYGRNNDWEDRTNPNNELTVYMPLGSASGA